MKLTESYGRKEYSSRSQCYVRVMPSMLKAIRARVREEAEAHRRAQKAS